MKQNDYNEMLNAVNSGDSEKMRKFGAAAASSLSDEQKNMINKAMSDPEYLKNVLSSPKAQEILKKLQGGEK